MKRIIQLVGLSFAAFAWTNLGFGQEANPIARKARAILKTHCYRCHGENGAVEGGVAYLLDTKELTARRKIVPGDPLKSLLIQRIVKNEMPPATEKVRPTDAELATLQEWIKTGANELQPGVKRTFVTPTAIVDQIWKDLSKLGEDDQRFARYVTLTHLYNAGEPDDVLETHRQGLSKLVNSLSWGPKIAVPTSIDPGRTIFRLDLRDYKWTKRTWGLIAGGYPYTALTGTGVERKCRDATQVDRFQIRADWFAAHATNGDHYYQILQLPVTTGELRKLFGLANDDDVTSGRVQRAGFLGSQVTPTARLIERHESHFGAFWIATSFADKKRLFDDPLVRAGGHAGSQGQQAMFHLPNGMLGFMVWDGSNRSTDVAKGLQDVRRPGAAVRSALSCMSCHTRGVLAKEDEVYPHAKKNGAPKATLDKVSIAYPSSKKFAEIVGEDSERFQAAVKKTGAQLGSADAIVALALRYEENLNLTLLAAELGMTPTQLKDKAAGSKYAKMLAGAGVAFKRRGIEEIYADLAQTFGLGKSPGRVLTGGPPIVFAEMLVPPRGKPVETIVAKKESDPGPKTFFNLPTPAPREIPNRLQVLTVRDHLVCQFTGYRGDRMPIAISPTGRLAAAESQMGIVMLFDPFSAEKRAELDGHNGSVSAIEFAPDGKLVVTAAADGAKLWRASSGLLLQTLQHPGAVNAVKFSSDGKTLATIGDQLALWTIPTGERVVLKTPKQGTSWTHIIAISPDLTSVAAASGKTFGIWDVQTGKLRSALKGEPNLTGSTTVAVFSPDGRWLASSGISQSIVLWDLKANEAKTVLRGHTAPVNAFTFSSDSKLLVSGAGKTTGATVTRGECKVWEVDIESHWKTLDGHTRAVTQVAIGFDCKILMTGGKDGVVRVWSLDKDAPTLVRKTPSEPFEGHFGSITGFVVSRDERRFLTGGADGTVRLWDAQSGAEIKSLAGHSSRVRAVAFSADGSTAFSSGDDLKLLEWNLDKGTIVKKSDLPKRTSEMRFSSTGKFLIVGIDGLAGQINTNSGKMVRKLEGFSKGITAIAIAADDRTIALCDLQRSIRIWDLNTEKVRSLRGMPKQTDTNNNTIESLAFSPDGEFLVSGSLITKTAGLWDLKTAEEIHRVGPFPGFVTGVQFAPDSKSIFVASGLTGIQPKKKSTVVLHCSVTQLDTGTGQAMQYWDQFTSVPSQMIRTGDNRQLVVVVGNMLMRMSTENGKTIAAP